MKPGHWGLLALFGFSVTWMGAVVLLWSGPALEARSRERTVGPATEPLRVAASPPAAASAPTPSHGDPHVDRLVQRLVDLLLGAKEDDEDELGRLQRELLEVGERAAPALVARLRRAQDAATHDRLLDLLRRVPGATAEEYLIEEAQAGSRGAARTLAIDALAERRTEATLSALEQIATTDPDLPTRPFITEPRAAGDDSTELPDEATFTPRMKAMAALASTQDPRAAPILSDILRYQADESLRMEAARQLAQLRGEPAAVDALLAGLGDGSSYVRLAALHSLEGMLDPRLPPTLEQLAAHDPDRGVALLAARLLARFRNAG